MACVLGAAALAAAALAASQKQKAQGLMDLVGHRRGKTPGEVDTAKASDAALVSELNKYKTDLAAKGYKFDDAGNITLPSGSTVPGSLSEQDMIGAGMSPANARMVTAGL